MNVGSNDVQRPSRYLFYRADWTNFTLRALITRDMVEGDNLNEVVNLVTKTIILAADASIPKSGLNFPKKRKPWWNKHCTDTNRNQRKAWNVFWRHPTSANQIAFQRAKAKDMWDNVRRACGIYPDKRISCLRKNGQEVRNTSEMVDVLAEAFASICSASNYTEPFLTHKNRMERIQLRFLTIFEMNTALSVIKHTLNGPDEEEGVPQGCILNVILFVLAINPILSVIPQTVQKNLYVDDLHISCYARNMQLIERQLQTAINNIVEWSNKSEFTISAQKAIGIHFCKRPLHPDPELFLSGVSIRFQDNYKFLGIVFDKRLIFLPHIASLWKRCYRSLNILRTLSNTSRGADRSCLLRVYRSIIRSMIDYGSVVYGSA
ncbi:hypothetical protein AVEN_261997-1 [Araneus ventricosus]|uniref:Reverse transcriptase domain-containing protein n=1 Tax=Araneus ventricosus TaxID=182803 RepID=A0A4Y2HCD5_ARAVE|nr:hypothetical protein AVEN_261997-1 [Araneus ventricosus]